MVGSIYSISVGADNCNQDQCTVLVRIEKFFFVIVERDREIRRKTAPGITIAIGYWSKSIALRILRVLTIFCGNFITLT